MRVNVSNCFSWCVGHHYMKSQSLEVVQPVAVIFKLFPADFWLLQEVWYQGHLPECAGCVATWWERMLRGMLQITIQLPPRLVVTVVIQMAELVDVVPIFQYWLWSPTYLLPPSSTNLALPSALPLFISLYSQQIMSSSSFKQHLNVYSTQNFSPCWQLVVISE